MGSDYPLYPALQPASSGSGGGQGGRMMLATAVCCGVLLLSLNLMPKAPPLPPAGPAPVPTASSDLATAPPAPAVPAWSSELSAGVLTAEVANGGAGIRRLTCLENPAASLSPSAILTFTTDEAAPALFAVAASDLSWAARWTPEPSDPSSARFSTVLPGGVALAKTLRLPASGYVLEMELEAMNPGTAPATADLRVLIPSLVELAGASARSGQVAVLAALLQGPDGSVLYKDVPSDPKKKLAETLPVRWAGMKGGYWAVLARPEGESVPASSLSSEPGIPRVCASSLSAEPGLPRVCASLGLGPWVLEPGASRKARILCYAGPMKDNVLAAADPSLPKILNRWILSTSIKAVLDLLHRLAGNYGVAIILLTLLVRAVIHPLNRMSQISMLTTSEKMKRLQPRLDEAKKRHKSDARKMMQEQTRIMKEEGMTPFSPVMGCLPMLLQMPVMIALYSVLREAVELRGAPFCLWIRDLSVPDSVLSGLPFIGSLNPLPIALIGVTVFQMWRAPKPADPQMAQQQKMMMYIMPVMFGFMFYAMPAGITLYWFTSTAFSIGEQAWIRRILASRGIGTGR